MRFVSVITTGGTFDKGYNIQRERLDFSLGSSMDEIMTVCHITDADLNPIKAMDSLDMQDTDRSDIALAVEHSASQGIVIVHGTGTMLMTASHLSQLGIPDKVVVLTGAMTPYRYSATEAMCNFGMAVAAARLLERPGIYIAMHGMVEPWNMVKKVNGVFSVEKALSAEAS